MTEFTPGPYTAKRAAIPIDGEYDYAIVVDINGAPYVIGEAFGRVDDTVLTPARVNAAMFAASYDMYKSLKEALGFLEDMNVVGDLPDTMREVIAKAEGVS